jgi:hypothetical protein
MAVWNTRLSVVANLDASSEAAALTELRKALTRAGFEVYDDDGDAFAAEDGTAVTELPSVFNTN